MSLDSAATFPAAIWDGDSGNRDSNNNNRVAPDYRDWKRLVNEIAATQRSNQGYDPDTALNSVGTIGTAAGLSLVERGNAAMHKTVISLTNVAMTMTDGSTPGTDAMWGTVPLYTFPVGHIIIVGAHLVFPLGLIIATVAGGGGLADDADLEFGVGTTARANQTNFALAAAEDNIVTEQVGVDLTSAASDAIESSQLAASLFFDGTTACVANLNFITTDDADAGTAADELDLTGTLTMLWTMQGDD